MTGRAGAAILGGACLLALCLGAERAEAQATLAARVNGVGITDARVERYFEEYLARNNRNVAAIRRPDLYENLRKQAVEELVDEELLWQEAKRRGLVASAREVDEELARARAKFEDDLAFDLKLEQKGFDRASYRKQIERVLSAQRLLQKVAGAVKVTAGEVHSFYEANPEKFTRPLQLRVRRILVSVRPGAGEEDRGKARERAEGALREVRGGADLAEVARRVSDDDGFGGGDLGFLEPVRLPVEVQRALGGLQDGAVSEVIESPDGFSVVRIEGRQGGDRVPEAEVREGIRQHLAQRKGAEAIQEQLASLRRKATIEYGRR